MRSSEGNEMTLPKYIQFCRGLVQLLDFFQPQKSDLKCKKDFEVPDDHLNMISFRFNTCSNLSCKDFDHNFQNIEV